MEAEAELGYYADPDRYDAEYAPFAADRDWYVRRARELGGPVLELGCGTGRILLGLAAAGLVADGLDLAPAMLDRCRERLLASGRLASRVGLFEADMRAFRLERRYRTAIGPINALMHLLTDGEVLACLGCVRAHLAPGGRFLFDLTFPRPELIEAFGGPRGEEVRTLRLRGGHYVQREQHRYDPASRISRVRHFFEPLGGGPGFATELRLRMYPPEAIEALLARAGLQVCRRYGDFAGSSLDPQSSVVQVYETRAEPRSSKAV
ncbi:MAG: class I SAM-dependent methyltransferase [Deltaproteobacteria bacterium]|nr:class I SAM-dependent methyltransferase [Deltaproteobacteria bacterium]